MKDKIEMKMRDKKEEKTNIMSPNKKAMGMQELMYIILVLLAIFVGIIIFMNATKVI